MLEHGKDIEDLEKQEPKREEYLVVEFRYGRISRLFGVLVSDDERGYLSRFKRVEDARTDVGGAVITFALRQHRDLAQWQIWVIPTKKLTHWLDIGGCHERLGMEVLQFSNRTAEGRVALEIGPMFPSLFEMLNQFDQAFRIHNRAFTHRLWTPSTYAEIAEEEEDGAGAS